MTIRAIIVDDIPLAIESLEYELRDHFREEIEVIATASGVLDAAKKIKKLSPQLVFLDIEMNDGDGFDLLDIVNQENIKVIFTTASRSHALKAFRYSAVDYLLKPIDQNQIRRALGKINNLAQKSGSEVQGGKYLSVSTEDAIRILDYNNVIRLEASSNYCYLYTEGGDRILSSKTLKYYEDQLNDSFLRVHQSHLVNLSKIKAYMKTEGGYLKMSDGSDVPVSVRKKQELIRILSNK